MSNVLNHCEVMWVPLCTNTSSVTTSPQWPCIMYVIWQYKYTLIWQVYYHYWLLHMCVTLMKCCRSYSIFGVYKDDLSTFICGLFIYLLVLTSAGFTTCIMSGACNDDILLLHVINRNIFFKSVDDLYGSFVHIFTASRWVFLFNHLN